jgi:hypothetical protein
MPTPTIFAKARHARPLTTAEIALTVGRPSRLIAAQEQLDELFERRDGAQNELRQLAGQLQSDPADDATKSARRIIALNTEIAEIDEEIRTATAERDAARHPWARALLLALGPMRAAAIEQAIAGVDALVAALRQIDEVTRELQERKPVAKSVEFERDPISGQILRSIVIEMPD